MKLLVWSPLPPSSSGIADYVAETLSCLAEHFEIELVCEDPSVVDPAITRQFAVRRPDETPSADLDLYHIGNSPPHAYVYRAALARPGVVVLHEWSLHHLVLGETVERGDRTSYLREMRRAYGETGTFVGRQVARALGGDVLPALFALNDRVLESCLGVVGLTEYVRSRAARRLPNRPVAHVPHHLSLPLQPLPSRAEARRHLGIPQDTLLLVSPGLATASKRLDVVVRTVARLREAHHSLRLAVAGGVDPHLPLDDWAREANLGSAFVVTGRLSLEDFVRYLCAADAVLALRFPSHGEISGALVRALGVGRPVLVTAGTPGADEFPEGIVVPVDPGRCEEEELASLLDHLLRSRALRDTIGTLAREYVLAHHDLTASTQRLASFLSDVLARKSALLGSVTRGRAEEGSLASYLMEEVNWAARDLGLVGLDLGLDGLVRELARP